MSEPLLLVGVDQSRENVENHGSRTALSTTVRNHWPESNTEPHTENITFYRNQEDLSSVASKEGVIVQTSSRNHASSDAPETLTVLTETANTGGRNESSGRTKFTISPVGHLSEIATALTSQSSTLALERLHLLSSSAGPERRIAPSQMGRGPSQDSLQSRKGLPEELTVHIQVATTSTSSHPSLPALEMGEPTLLSRKRDSSGPEFSVLPFSRTPAYSPPPDLFSPSEGMEELKNSTDLQSPSVSQTESTHVATTFTDGVARMLQSLTVSLGPINETEGFPEHPKVATTSVSVPSSPSAVELRRNSRVTGTPGDGEFMEPSTDSELGVTSLHWQNDSPTFGGHPLTSSSEAENGSSVSQTETVSRSVPSVSSGESTARWFLTNNKTFADVTGSSALYSEVVNASVLTQFLNSARQSGGNNTALGDKSHSESLSTSSSESLDSSAPRGERSTVEESRPHTSATITGSGERTGRSVPLGNASTTSGEVGSPAATVSREAEHAPQRTGATDHTGLVAAPALGVTGISNSQVSGTDLEQKTSSGHTDHTYLSSTFTKGERALLSITDNSSSSDVQESSTSHINVSDSSHSDYFSSSHAQTERSNTSSLDGEYTQPSTESLVPQTSTLPSYTSTIINMPHTLVLLDADAGSVGDSSSSGPPLPLPSVSQSHQLFSPTLPSTRTSAHPLKSTSEAYVPLPSSPSPVPVSVTASTPAPLPVPQTASPRSSSTTVLPRARETPVTSVHTSTVAEHQSCQTADPKNQGTPHQEKIITESESPSLVSLLTESTKAVTLSSPSGVPLPPALTESSTKQTLPAGSTSLDQMFPALTATTFETSHPPITTPGTPPSTVALTTGPVAVQTTAGKQLLLTHPEILVPQISTEGGVTTKRNPVHTDATTQLIPPTSIPTSAKELTTRLGVTEEYSPASRFFRTSPPQTTDVPMTEVLASKSTALATQSSTQSPTALSSPSSVNSCATNPCLHDGECIVDLSSRGHRCMCSPSWQGDDCSVDVNECLSNPCPPLAMCNNTQGSFICKCPVGYQLEKGICNLVRTFVTEFKLKKTFFNTTVEKHSDLHEFENDITKTLNVCFSTLPGYIRSTVHASRESSVVAISLQTTFSLASNVTLFDLADGIQQCVNSCRSSAEVCQFLGSQRRIFRAGSLCKRKSPECDKETSICTDLDGVALCQCKSGYFQFNKMDHSCRACEDGYRLENETCMSCPFGLGGLNCGNPYQLITVVIAAAGGGLLLILGIALIVTCCRKNKNDISKLIFKSGDFQMSPYAEYPKNPRSQEWGREAIEMHENGSTKNLLQMTDVYYSPTNVRNPELERNGLYLAYTGLPGSRHSCIFPGQYNPSFISDESRRRDYF
ncbi:PREDICTED: protein HEG homolog 1 [Galeopterus variegatus]|uniref:Protein HEG homolog 1 n=1 Tax=Galeopterus variegatus TaxID=482537 RepID=A0ABM0R5H7_GALVR|nr:PREDICTED: protein HEG homolog 1 [Galeopterus variegatus]